MLREPTTLANVARIIGVTLEKDYGIDPARLYEQVNIDASEFLRPGSRVPLSKMTRLWDEAVFLTNDLQFGVKVGLRARPSGAHALGHAWLASATLRDALEKYCRYAQVVSTAARGLEVVEEDGMLVFVEEIRDPTLPISRAALEFAIVAFFNFCEILKREPVRPLKAELFFQYDEAHRYLEEFLQCPVTYGNEREKFYFSREQFDERLPGYVPEVLDSTSRIIEEYLESLDQSKVATDVKRLLIQMLPSGKADQDKVASRLYRSTSTLQRQLSAEGTSYRDLLETTRRSLAEKYLRDGKHTQAEIAYMVGFSDQSNFARAFKRWTGLSPGQFQKAG
jgi:AraC-like DNA-binding protein